MHILLIHQAFAALDEPGGTRHAEFAQYLVDHGHRVTVIASPISYLTGAPFQSPSPEGQGIGGERKRKAPLEEEGGLGVIRISVYSAHHKSFAHRLLAFLSFMVSSLFAGLRVRDVDLVWGTSPPTFQAITAWALARLKGAKFLFEVRDLWPDFAIAVGVLRNPLLIRLARWVERFLYSHANQVMVNSPGYVEHVRGRGAARVALISNGADPQMFDPADNGAEFRAANHLEDKFIALYAGAHGMSNDLGVVLQAAALLDQEPKIAIVLLGDGKEKPALEARAEELALRNVTFLPPVPKAEMGPALAGANACIAILKPLEEYKTTYPNKVFDYMAAGRPIVLAMDGVIRQVVEAAGCGIFVGPGDPAALANAIRRLAADQRGANEMGMAGRLYLQEHFSREALAREFEQLLVGMQ